MRCIINDMKLESVGILISLRPFGERDAVARIFTRDYGVMCGVVRAAFASHQRRRPMVGTMGDAVWNARLDSQLGTFHWDANRNLVVEIMSRSVALKYMNAVFELIGALLPERECFAKLYDETLDFLSRISGAHDDEIAAIYQGWELSFLMHMGYALDLTRCASCGGTHDLKYLSPRTGRAVCATCGAPYVGRLYDLPISLGVTGRFLDDICTQMGIKIPVARAVLGNK